MQHPSRRHRMSQSANPMEGLAPLEPRQLLTTYTMLDSVDAFNLDQFMRTVLPSSANEVENFGYNIASLGDVNADGRPDFAVAAPGRLPDPIGRWGGPDADEGPVGRVFIYSGADLSRIRTLTNNTRGFGASMAGVGDMDGDGVNDLVVGSPNFDDDADAAVDHHGRITIYSGATGGVVRTIDGAGDLYELGYSLANIGDFDGDGHDDVIVGAPGAGPVEDPLGAGCAFVYSLIDGELLHTFTGMDAGERFGHSVAGGADITSSQGDPDGVSDFLVGAPGYDSHNLDAGRAYVFDGQSGELFTNGLLGDGAPPPQDGLSDPDINVEPGDRFGSSVAFMGANSQGVFGSGLMRILVGAPGADKLAFSSVGDPIADRGIVYSYIYAGGDLGLIVDSNFAPKLEDAAEGDFFGERITMIGDVTGGDDVSEIAILAPGNDRGERLTIGNGNFTNFTATGVANVGNYSSMAVIGDRDNDGVIDLAFGEPDDSGEPVRVQVLPFTLATTMFIGAASDDGNYIILGGSLGSVDGSSGAVGYLIHDGRPTSLLAAGLDGLSVSAVNNAGLFFATRSLLVDGVFTTEQYLVYQGARTRLEDAIHTTSGPAPTSQLGFASMNNVGDLVFNASNGAYLLRGGILSFLWEGRVGHVNDSGLVAGIGPETNPGFPQAGVLGIGFVRLFTPAGLFLDVRELYSTGTGRFINNDGLIIGCRPAGELVMYSVGPDGTGYHVGPGPSNIGHYNELGLAGRFWNWSVTDISERDGKVGLQVNHGDIPPGRPPSALNRSNYFYEFRRAFYPGLDPDYDGLRPTGEVIADPLFLPPPSGSGHLIDRIIDGNAIIVSGHLGIPAPQAGSASTAEDHLISATWNSRGLDVAVSATSGQGLILRLTGKQAGLWLSSALPIAGGGVVPPPILPEVTLYTDPRDKRSYALALFDGTLVWFTQIFEGVYDEGREIPLPAPITSRLVIFTSADERVHVVGTSADGDVIMLYQLNQLNGFTTGLYDIDNWASVNLSQDHLDPQGQSTPNFVSDLTAYVTPWNGLNIAGIDSDGRVHTVWWTPGLTFWQTSNLSDIATAPALTGNVTSYVTSWSGLNVAGTTDSGEVCALWWVPELGGEWRFDVLLPEESRGLRPGSLSAYVTSWGGLNVAGVDPDTDKVAVYWWTPTTPWVFENIQVDGTSPDITGRVTAIATPPGQLDILARGESDELLRFSWNPGDDSVWSVENIGDRAL